MRYSSNDGATHNYGSKGVRQPVDVRKIVRTVGDTFIAVAKSKGLDFRMEVGEDVPPALLADETRLQQILSNLLGPRRAPRRRVARPRAVLTECATCVRVSRRPPPHATANAFKFTSTGFIHVRVGVLPDDGTWVQQLEGFADAQRRPDKEYNEVAAVGAWTVYNVTDALAAAKAGPVTESALRLLLDSLVDRLRHRRQHRRKSLPAPPARYGAVPAARLASASAGGLTRRRGLPITIRCP